MTVSSWPAEAFTEQERALLGPYFTNLDGPVFALVNLPEVVKAALFARYSRSPKSLRRLFLDEFLDEVAGASASRVGEGRSAQLFDKVFLEYGDDSVAQLAAVHVACEGVSNVATKLLEWGRVAAYLEQSTRYIPYTDRPGGRWRYLVPPELAGFPHLADRFSHTLDSAFETYAAAMDPLRTHLERAHPRPPEISASAHARAVRARVLDLLRGLLPAATRSNLGIFASAQAYEALVIRLRANPLAEARALADAILVELRKVVPAFMTRVDRPERGREWSEYLRSTRAAVEAVADQVLPVAGVGTRPEVTLTDFDPDGEVKVVAAALYTASGEPDDQLVACARAMTSEQRATVLAAYCGVRRNRRHKPGRAFERTAYRFDVLGDYGAFRDLQRHRMLTLEWQPLSTAHGYAVPEDVEAAGLAPAWHETMRRCADLYAELDSRGLGSIAPYAVPMAFRIRFCIQMNAREAMHMLELRSAPQGHPSYRRICQAMHRLIAEGAGHRAIAGAMAFVNHEMVDLERLEAEARAEKARDPGRQA
ncbi:MAG: FAD-dependent thymidylate synthase [Acidobacteriota bacterium]